jgi:hypothetical protein
MLGSIINYFQIGGHEITDPRLGEHMTRVRLTHKALSLCALIVVAMALIVGAAHPEGTSNWRVNGTNVNSTLLPEVQVKELENKTGSLLFTTKGGTQVEVLCTSAALSNVKLKATGSLAEFNATFSGCLTKLNGSVVASCKPKSFGTASGTIQTLKLLGLLVLASVGVPVTRITPETGTLLATIEFGELCLIGESAPVNGLLFIKDCKGETSVERVEHLVEEAAGTTITALGQAATLDGSAILALTGAAHIGLKWSGVAG